MCSAGSRLHSFQDPKYIRTSLTPAAFSATSLWSLMNQTSDGAEIPEPFRRLPWRCHAQH